MFLGQGFFGSKGKGGSGPGRPGRNGETPSIGSNGNWYIGTKDTGVSSRGTSSPYVLTADKVHAVTNRGVAPDSGSLAGLDTGWWYVPKSYVNITGMPAKLGSDIVLYKNVLTDQYGRNKGIMLAYGLDINGDEAMWVRYKVANVWENWIEFKSLPSADPSVTPPAVNKQIGVIQGEIAKLKTQTASEDAAVAKMQVAAGKMIGKISANEQALSSLYAPDKLTFTNAVTSLITAALSNYQPDLTAITSKLQNLANMIIANSNKLNSQDARITVLEKAQSRTPVNPKGGGGDKPVLQLPRIYAMFSLSTPTSLSGAVTSTNGKVTLHRIPTTRSRVFILVENENNEASKVKTISVNGGWAAAWQPRDTVIDGKKYRAFYSAGAYTEKTLDLVINFG